MDNLHDPIVITCVTKHDSTPEGDLLRLYISNACSLLSYVNPAFYGRSPSDGVYTVWSAVWNSTFGLIPSVLNNGTVVGYKRGVAGTFAFSVAPNVPGYELMLAVVLNLNMEGPVDVGG